MMTGVESLVPAFWWANAAVSTDSLVDAFGSLHVSSHTMCHVLGNLQKAPCSRANGGAQLRCLQHLDNPEWGPEAEWIGEGIDTSMPCLRIQCIVPGNIERERENSSIAHINMLPSRIKVLGFRCRPSTEMVYILHVICDCRAESAGPPVAPADSALPIGSPPLWGCPDFNNSFAALENDISGAFLVFFWLV